jgi:hypothetical protein
MLVCPNNLYQWILFTLYIVLRFNNFFYVGLFSHMREERDVYNVLMGKPEGNTALGRPRHRWDQNGC